MTLLNFYYFVVYKFITRHPRMDDGHKLNKNKKKHISIRSKSFGNSHAKLPSFELLINIALSDWFENVCNKQSINQQKGILLRK